MAKKLTLTFPGVLFCCFLCGTAAGTIAANCLSGELLRQLGCFASVCGGSSQRRIFSTDPASTQRTALSSGSLYFAETAGRGSLGQRQELWRYVVRQRAAEYGLGVLVGMTPFAAAGFAALLFAAGFASGLMIAVMTLEKGLMGLPWFLLLLFPQWCFYLPVWLFLAVRSEDGLTGVRLRSWPVLALLAAAGTFLESYVNPILLGL